MVKIPKVPICGLGWPAMPQGDQKEHRGAMSCLGEPLGTMSAHIKKDLAGLLKYCKPLLLHLRSQNMKQCTGLIVALLGGVATATEAPCDESFSGDGAVSGPRRADTFDVEHSQD